MVEMCDFIPCRKEFLYMASSPQANVRLVVIEGMNSSLIWNVKKLYTLGGVAQNLSR